MQNGPTQVSILEQHAATLDLLEEVRDYLMRLPVAPATRDVCRRIDAHIAAPDQAVAREAVSRALRERNKLVGGLYTPAGVVLVEAEVDERRLALRSPHVDVLGDKGRRRVIALLHEGVVIDLRSPWRSLEA